MKCTKPVIKPSSRPPGKEARRSASRSGTRATKARAANPALGKARVSIRPLAVATGSLYRYFLISGLNTAASLLGNPLCAGCHPTLRNN